MSYIRMRKRDLKDIARQTRPELVGTFPCIQKTLGYFQKRGANWSYWLEMTTDDELVITVYGRVVDDL